MNAVFLDTSGLVAVVNTDDQWHTQAEKVWSVLISSQAALVTTSLVLVELADGLSRIRHRPLASQVVDGLRASERVTIIQSDATIEKQAWKLFRDRMDKEWGMTDCVSMTLMTEQAIDRIFTADSHFVQAGFEILVK